MTNEADIVIDTLNHQFLSEFPSEAVNVLELFDPAVSASLLSSQPIPMIGNVLELLSPDTTAPIVKNFPDSINKALLSEGNPNLMVKLLGSLEDDERNRLLSLVGPSIHKDYMSMMSYAEDSAGRLMDTRFHVFRESMSVRQCLKRLHELKFKPTRTLFLVNNQNKLVSRVEMQDLALAEPMQELKELAQPLQAFVNPTDPKEEVVSKMEEFKISNLPVLGYLNGGLVGCGLRYDALVKAALKKKPQLIFKRCLV